MSTSGFGKNAPKQFALPSSVDLCEVLNATVYQYTSGRQWDMLPHALLSKSTVYDDFAQWRVDGTLKRINERPAGRSDSFSGGAERETGTQCGEHR